MIVEVNRLIADWLDDDTDGVNALLATTPVDDGDDTPADIATIADETRDDDVARDELPDAPLPAITVSLDAVVAVDGHVQIATRDGRARMRVRISVENAETADGKRDLGYYVRTVVRSLQRLFDSDASDSRRRRNDIYLESCDDMTWALVRSKDQAGNAVVDAYVLFTVQLRDLDPTG